MEEGEAFMKHTLGGLDEENISNTIFYEELFTTATKRTATKFPLLTLVRKVKKTGWRRQ